MFYNNVSISTIYVTFDLREQEPPSYDNAVLTNKDYGDGVFGTHVQTYCFLVEIHVICRSNINTQTHLYYVHLPFSIR